MKPYSSYYYRNLTMNYNIRLKIYIAISIAGIMGLLVHGFPNDALATLDIPGSQSTTTTTTNYRLTQAPNMELRLNIPLTGI
jgi:hypothetical protein